MLLSGALAAQTASIQFDGSVFRIEGWTAGAEAAGGWGAVLTVRVDSADAPAMLGSYSVLDGHLQFRPRFPLADGLRYRADASLPDGRRLSLTVERPRAVVESVTQVEHVYPSAETLPSNVLKLYIQFTAPMSKGEAWQHIHLLDDSGQPVPLAFLEVDQELWDAGGKRLTVLFDPGRIKRGLVPISEMGSAITEGRSYRLVIDKDWHDARGASLASGYEKRFRGGPSERRIPSTDRWQVRVPAAGTAAPLVIRFPAPMDAALMQRMIRVEGVDGRIETADEEREMRFTPLQPWKAGTYRIVADNLMEDIAGNHLDRPFDVDLSTQVATSANSSGTSTLPFIVP